MQLVVEISEDTFFDLKKKQNRTEVDNAVLNGTPLPEGHGRLIDADEYKEHLYACETNDRPSNIMELYERLATVDEAPTIIEADKAESEEV